MLPRTRKRREPGWGDAAKQVLETVKYDMDVAEILEQIGKHNIKTVRGSIDDRDALRRVLEQTPETFYAKADSKFGLTSSNRRSAVSNTQNGSKRKNNGNNNDSSETTRASKNGNNGNNGGQSSSTSGTTTNGTKKPRKDSSERLRKISTDDLLSPETPLIGINFKDFINEEKFNKLGVHIQWELMKLLPACDVDIGPNGLPLLGRDCFSNEFFNRALTGFPERITDGEFTVAMKARVNIETSRRRIDPWKEKFFEQYWGQLENGQKDQAKHDKWAQLEKGMKKELKSPIKINSPKRSPKNSPKRVWSPSRSPNRSSPKTSPKKQKKDYPEINRSDQTVIKTWDAINAVRSLQTGSIQRDEPKRAQSVIKQQPILKSCKPETSQGSSVTASPAGSSLVSSDSPASQRGPSTSPSQIESVVVSSSSPRATVINKPPRDSPPPPLVRGTVNPSTSAPGQKGDQKVTYRLIHKMPNTVTRVTTGAGFDKAANFAQLKLPPIPALIPSPNYSSIVGQKRTRTLADAKNEMQKMKCQRPTVISYAPALQRGTPVRVIKQVQKAVPTDRVLILSPVVSSESSPPVYRLTNHASTPLQKSSLGTNVIQTVQLQQSQSDKKTYVIKGQTMPTQQQQGAIQQCRSSVVHLNNRICRNETYAQCTKCHVLVQLSKSINLEQFICQTCLSSYSTK